MDQLFNLLNLSQETIVFLTAFSVLTFLSGIIVLPWLIWAIPSDYFIDENRHPMQWKFGGKLLRPLVLIIKNLLGFLLVIFGVAMLVLPGQGILTILAGLVLMDFPGKFHLLRSIATRKQVLNSLNWIRRKGNRRPFETSESDID